MEKNKNRRLLTLLGEYGLIVVGSILYVISVKSFAAPMQIPSGGVSGIALLTNYLWNLPIGVVTMALNIPLLLAGFKGLGRDFFCKTMFMIVFSSILTDMAGFLPVFEGDILLAAIFGGILKGVGYGLIIRTGGTSGGVDVIGKFMYKHFSVQMGTTSMTVNVGVLLLSAFGLGSLELLMYGIIMQYAVSNMTDMVVYGSDHQKKTLIVTKRPREVADALMERIGHGVTALEGQGMYTGEERLVLMCVIRPHEANAVKKLVLEIDDTAFIMLSDVNEVLGRGFKQLRAND
ncbi:MAG: YitT family protein [Clostridia bacterium]|nr:YitT family protein [Clostridia bacterium]